MAHEFQLVVRGATVANADGHVVADVAVRDGLVVEVGAQVAGSGERELDGRGKVLAPGGIDPHTHFHTPSPDGSLMSADDYESGTRAAAAGGVTTRSASPTARPSAFWAPRPGRVRWSTSTPRTTVSRTT